MIKIVLMGAVDAGKTTFFKHYFSGKISQKHHRTQEIRSLYSRIGSFDVELLDCPGHEALGIYKSLAVAMADVVIYIVDATKIDTRVLDQLADKQRLVLINKIDRCSFFNEFKDLTLKEVVQDPSKRIRFHVELSKLLAEHEDLAPFLDNDTSKVMCFPLSCRTGFGIQEFENFMEKFYLQNVKHPDVWFLYKKRSSEKGNEYGAIGQPESGKFYLNLDSRNYDLESYVSYNPTKKVFVAKDDLGPLIKVFSSPGSESSKVEYVKVEEKVPIPSQLQELTRTLHHVQHLEFVVCSESELKRSIMSDFMQRLGLNVKLYFTDPDVLRKVKKDYEIVVEWTQDQSRECFLKRTTFYDLVADLESFLRTKQEQFRAKIANECKARALAKLLDNYVFKREKRSLLIGCRLTAGTLRPTSYVLTNSSNSLSMFINVVSMQDEQVSTSMWDNPKKDLAIRIECDDVSRIFDQKLYYLKSKDLDEFLSKEYNTEEYNVLKSTYDQQFK